MKLFFLLLLPLFAVAQFSREFLFNSFDGAKIHYDVGREGKPVVLLYEFMSSDKSPKRLSLGQLLVDAVLKVVVIILARFSDLPLRFE